MPSSRSDIGRTWVLLAGLLLIGAGPGCDELNPDFDPDGGPVCSLGERRCNPDNGLPEVCQSLTAWTTLSECWPGSGCGEGVCLPDAPVERCDSVAACATAGDVCTVLVDPDTPTQLGTFCLEPPIATGRPGGQACSTSGDCQSGWCFRRVCYEACEDASHCTNVLHECALLDITVDGVHDSVHIHGCVPPAE